MKIKIVMLLSAMSLIAFSAAAQKSRAERIDQLAKDPKTAENAAKADVYIVHHEKIIMDTAQQQVAPAPAKPATRSEARKKKKS